MQENEFEKGLQKQMENFSVFPDVAVWQKVQSRISKKKRRRLLIFWLLAGLMIMGGASALFFLSQGNKALTKTSYPVKHTDDNVNGKMATVKKTTTSRGRVKILLAKKQAVKTIARPVRKLSSFSSDAKIASLQRYKNLDLSNKGSKQYLLGQPQPQAPNRFNTENNSLQQRNVPASSKNITNKPVAGMEGRKPLPPHRFLLPGKAEGKDSLQLRSASFVVKGSNNDTLNRTPKEPALKELSQKSAANKWKPGFTVYTGISGNIRQLGTASEKSAAVGPLGSSVAPSASSNTATPAAPQLEYNGGLSVGAGIYFRKALKDKFTITIGVDYHFMSARSMVGTKTDSTINIFDSVLQQATTANSFYRAGQSNTFSNKYHLIQLPVNLRLQLNGNTRHPLWLSLGLSPSFFIATDALYLNTKTNTYYEQNKQFNRFMLFGQTELLYVLTQKQKFQFAVGPALHYDFNSFSKPVIAHTQHLTFIGIKAAIQIK
ncbi:MAG: hypothetical protein M3040_05795 [Bacteroidota bacterium]|nr:hypothetical protein [Bacteroidota bacterium]